jgi:hypothetical protein
MSEHVTTKLLTMILLVAGVVNAQWAVAPAQKTLRPVHLIPAIANEIAATGTDRYGP